MSYEEAVKAKHAFEDSLNDILYLLSVMDRRELELVAAKLGDGVAHEDNLIDRDSALLTARVIAMVLQLRANEVVAQHKWRRAWLRRKKKTLADEVAELETAPEIKAYPAERRRIGRVRELEIRNYNATVRKWERNLKSLPLMRRLFGRPKRPTMPDLTPLPTPPRVLLVMAGRMNQEKDFGEILVERVYYHVYPSIEYADDVVNEDHVRQRAVALLEDKR